MAHQVFHTRVSGGRRIVLPAEACKQLKVGIGGTLIVDVSEGRVQLHSLETSLAEFRAALAKKVPPGVSIVDELIAERRAEAERE
jgi:bifunctional DNA-binding transcriptional regulator/antitoxin component of YhaV-PrlF toxin-antitoxin module